MWQKTFTMCMMDNILRKYNFKAKNENKNAKEIK